jgi:hypothetical protein
MASLSALPTGLSAFITKQYDSGMFVGCNFEPCQVRFFGIALDKNGGYPYASWRPLFLRFVALSEAIANSVQYASSKNWNGE